MKKHLALIQLEDMTALILNSMNMSAKEQNIPFTYHTEWKKGEKAIENNIGNATKNYYAFRFYMNVLTKKEVDKEVITGEGEFAIKKIVKVKENAEERIDLYGAFYPLTIKDQLNINQLLERAYKEFMLKGIASLASISYGFYMQGEERIKDIQKVVAEKKEQEIANKTKLS
jgi:hypothetical protein